jgi:ABC-type transport system involved in multi-copper enzyme maturation permease subunit
LATVAWFEVVDAVRSRKAIALLTLYVAGSGAAAALLVHVIQQIEEHAAEALHVASTERPGTMTEGFLLSDSVRQGLREVIGDASIVDALAAVPPIALFYGWLSLSFLPGLVMLTSADAISSELQSGEARYALVRVDRLTWAVGKLGGQSLLMGLGIVLGGAACWVVGAFGWADFEAGPTALWMLRLGGRAWVYGFAWLGLALAISQTTASSAGARALGLVALAGVGIVGGVLSSTELPFISPVVAQTILVLLPRGHEITLWQPDPVLRWSGMAMLMALGTTYFALGHQLLSRRDV